MHSRVMRVKSANFILMRTLRMWRSEALWRSSSTSSSMSSSRAVAQAGTVEEKMDVFLDSMEQSALSGGVSSARDDAVSDEEIDRMIQADVLAQEKGELGKLDELESEIAKELGATKQKD